MHPALGRRPTMPTGAAGAPGAAAGTGRVTAAAIGAAGMDGARPRMIGVAVGTAGTAHRSRLAEISATMAAGEESGGERATAAAAAAATRAGSRTGVGAAVATAAWMDGTVDTMAVVATAGRVLLPMEATTALRLLLPTAGRALGVIGSPPGAMVEAPVGHTLVEVPMVIGPTAVKGGEVGEEEAIIGGVQHPRRPPPRRLHTMLDVPVRGVAAAAAVTDGAPPPPLHHLEVVTGGLGVWGCLPTELAGHPSHRLRLAELQAAGHRAVWQRRAPLRPGKRSTRPCTAPTRGVLRTSASGAASLRRPRRWGDGVLAAWMRVAV